jgi:DNA-binding NarL/FixJ family response regulator
MSVGANVALASTPSKKSPGHLAWSSAAHGNPRGFFAPTSGSGARLESDAITRAAVEARIALEEAVNAAVLAAQRARSVSVALEEVLASLKGAETAPVSAPASRADSDFQAGALSPREREVLALVAEGRSNKAIAEELFVSPNTVKSHVASLLSKLHAETRVQLAVIAARQATL